MLVCSLGSGSSGNATLVRSASGRTVLIDCGVQYPRLCKHLTRLGIRPGDIAAVYLSHEHSDHTQSAQPLPALWGMPIIAGQELVDDAPWLRELVTETFVSGQQRAVGDLSLVPISVAHDASATYGFTIEADGCTAAVFTDLGTGSDAVRSAVARADLTIIEANYDCAMLDAGAYPRFLKARIKGHGGHLSNDDCAAVLVGAFPNDRPRDVWLAHLSANNNRPEVAAGTVLHALREAGFHRTRVAALPRYALGPTWAMIRHRQLTLFGEGG